MSDYSQTPNLSLYKPNYALDVGHWGDHLNSNADILDNLLGPSGSFLVTSFNTRTGAVSLNSGDVTGALGFTPYNATNPANYITAAGAPVQSVAARTGAVTLTHSDITDWAATLAPYALLASPIFTGIPVAPTATAGTNTTQLATTAFVTGAISAIPAGVASFNTRTGAVSLISGDVTGALGFTPYDAANPASYITAAGAPVQSVATRTGAVTLTHTDITDWAATLAPYALLASPTFTGTPSLPTGTTGITQTAGSNTTALATTAFVQTALPVASSTTPGMDGTAAVGTGTTYARADHVHPSDTSRLPLAGGTLTGQLSLSRTLALNTGSAQMLQIGDTVAANSDPFLVSYVTGSASGALSVAGFNVFYDATVTAQRINTAKNGWWFAHDVRNATNDGSLLLRIISSGGSVATAVTFDTAAGITAGIIAGTYFRQGGSGPTWTSGTGAPASTQPIGSMYSRTDGAVGTTLYVSRGAGTWNAVAGV